MSNVYTRYLSAPRISRNGRIYPGGISTASSQGGSGGGVVVTTSMYRITFVNADLNSEGDDIILTVDHNKNTHTIEFTVWDNNNEEVVGLRKVRTSSNQVKIYVNQSITGTWSVNIIWAS